MKPENSHPPETIRPEDLMEELGIKKETYYRDLRYLEIEHQKDSSGRAYLSTEQANQIRALRNHVEQNGKRSGFESSSIVKATDSSISQSTEEIKVNGSSPEEQMAALVRSAAELRADTEVAKYLIASQMRTEMLPPDLRAKVEAAKAAVVPKSTAPNSWAQELVAKANQYMKQQQQEVRN